MPRKRDKLPVPSEGVIPFSITYSWQASCEGKLRNVLYPFDRGIWPAHLILSAGLFLLQQTDPVDDVADKHQRNQAYQVELESHL